MQITVVIYGGCAEQGAEDVTSNRGNIFTIFILYWEFSLSHVNVLKCYLVLCGVKPDV